jgi:hypothetical protein
VTKFRKIVEFCNKLTGTEKTHKYVYLYHKDGLKIFASDGCINSIFNLRQSVDYFKGAYALSIKTLKLFIDKQSDEDLAIFLNSNEIMLKQANEMLSIQQKPVRNPPERHVFDLAGELSAGDFLSGLDFSTVHIPEDDNCYFFVFEGILYILTVYDRIFCLYHSGVKCKPFESTVPYQSLRHLIKAQGTLKSDKIKLGISLENEQIGFQTAGLLTSICSRSLEENEEERLKSMIRIYRSFKPLYKIDKKTLNHNVTKADRISAGLPIKMNFEGMKILFEVKSETFYYSCRAKIDERYHEKNVEFTILGKYLKSALSRITSKYVYLYHFSRYLAIGDAEKTKMIVFAVDYIN